MLDDDHRRTHCSHPSRNRIDTFNYAHALKGFVLTGTEGVLDVDDQKGGGHTMIL